MQRGSRFAYMLDFRKASKHLMSEHHHEDSGSEIHLRNMLTPDGTSHAITGPSTHYNNESKANVLPEGLSCFGKATLETLNIKQRVPTIDF